MKRLYEVDTVQSSPRKNNINSVQAKSQSRIILGGTRMLITPPVYIIATEPELTTWYEPATFTSNTMGNLTKGHVTCSVFVSDMQCFTNMRKVQRVACSLDRVAPFRIWNRVPSLPKRIQSYCCCLIKWRMFVLSNYHTVGGASTHPVGQIRDTTTPADN